MLEDRWTAVTAYPDRASAEALLGLLDANAVPGYIASNEHVPGLGSHFAVLVPDRLLHRAQWVIAQCRVSERELIYLATGELPAGPEDT